MHLRTRVGESRVEMQMTPMIDMVFQLLIYFLFTFRISAVEGDFNIKLPKAVPPVDAPVMLPFTVQLKGDEAGNLRQVITPSRVIAVTPGDRASARAAFASLLADVKDFVGQDTGPNSLRTKAEARISADNLHYRYVIDAITHISGYRQGGQTVRLIER